MSNTQNPNQVDDTQLSTTAPPLTGVSSGGYSLMPSVKLPKRKFTGVDPKIDIKLIASDVEGDQYKGQNLINSKGIIARGQYSEDEAYSELAKLSVAERRQVQNSLYAVGAYGKSKPSRSGFNSQDFSAMREAMLVANAEGVTLDVALTLMATKYGGQPSGGTAKRIRTTAKQDVAAVFRRVSGELLGRRLSDAEVNKFVKSYNRMETTEAMGGATAPSVEATAVSRIEAKNPQEASAMGLLRLTNIIDDSIKGLG